MKKLEQLVKRLRKEARQLRKERTQIPKGIISTVLTLDQAMARTPREMRIPLKMYYLLGGAAGGLESAARRIKRAMGKPAKRRKKQQRPRNNCGMCSNPGCKGGCYDY